MNIQSMLAKIDKQIARLTNKRGQLAKAALLMAELTPPKTAGKGKITPAGRKRIADAQRKRWARQALESGTDKGGEAAPARPGKEQKEELGG